MNLKSSLLPCAVLVLSLPQLAGPILADEVKLKSGQVLTGRILFENDDLIRIEVPVSASIKETKIIARGDIESIKKDDPDTVEFERIAKFVPTGSLLSAEDYRRLLETGPDSFLKAHPNSPHVPKIREIRDTLAKELDQVERGYLKIEEDWITPQDKIDFKELVDSRIRLLRMNSYARGGNLNSLIAAMREFEYLDENYVGSPSFPQAVELAKQVVSNLGRQLQTLAANVDYQNAEYEKALAASSPESRARTAEARAREDKSYADSIAAEKKAGVKWVQLNPRNKQAINDYLKLASTELSRINGYDPTALAAQAEQLVAVDQLIAENRLAEARTKLTEATGSAGPKPTSKSKSKGGASSGSYAAILNGKILAKTSEEAEKAKAKEAASRSEALTADLKRSEGDTPITDDAAAAGKEDEAGEGKAKASEAAKPDAPEVDEFAALASAKKSSSGKASDEKSSPQKSKSKSKTSSRSGDDDEEAGAKRPRPVAVVDDGGGFPFWLIGVIVSGLAVVAAVAMKYLGFGGKKSED